MNNDAQIYFNLAVAVVGGLGGWILNNLRDAMRVLQESDTILSDKLQKIEVLVAGQYVKHPDLDKLEAALLAMLEKIDRKLDSKVDKTNNH